MSYGKTKQLIVVGRVVTGFYLSASKCSQANLLLLYRDHTKNLPSRPAVNIYQTQRIYTSCPVRKKKYKSEILRPNNLRLLLVAVTWESCTWIKEQKYNTLYSVRPSVSKRSQANVLTLYCNMLAVLLRRQIYRRGDLYRDRSQGIRSLSG